MPMRREVAGVAMGLILSEDGTPTILTDILGLEDALGDMDFKVAGDADTISAFQMDIKVEGITVAIMRQALAAAGDARRQILLQMELAKPEPRRRLGRHVARVREMVVPGDKVGAVIGPGGAPVLLQQFGWCVLAQVLSYPYS